MGEGSLIPERSDDTPRLDEGKSTVNWSTLPRIKQDLHTYVHSLWNVRMPSFIWSSKMLGWNLMHLFLASMLKSLSVGYSGCCTRYCHVPVAQSYEWCRSPETMHRMGSRPFVTLFRMAGVCPHNGKVSILLMIGVWIYPFLFPFSTFLSKSILHRPLYSSILSSSLTSPHFETLHYPHIYRSIYIFFGSF
jgi:hypothetical protein